VIIVRTLVMSIKLYIIIERSDSNENRTHVITIKNVMDWIQSTIFSLLLPSSQGRRQKFFKWGIFQTFFCRERYLSPNLVTPWLSACFFNFKLYITSYMLNQFMKKALFYLQTIIALLIWTDFYFLTSFETVPWLSEMCLYIRYILKWDEHSLNIFIYSVYHWRSLRWNLWQYKVEYALKLQNSRDSGSLDDEYHKWKTTKW